MGKRGDGPDYESLREARILENQARMEALGLRRAARELTEMTAAAAPSRRPWTHKQYATGPPRRSSRLNGNSVQHRALPLKGCLGRVMVMAAAVADSRGRGGVYDSPIGFCCHFCRQKKLCGEEDCKRCGKGNVKQPCLGKTECTSCHSSSGILCRACLKLRYGEEMEEVRKNKNWMCPHCIEEKGIKKYWICNSSICLKKRKIAPIGIADAWEQGYESVAHLLLDRLKRQAYSEGL